MIHTLVIAEAGVNHNGDLNLAFRLVEAAAQAGADVVKFQTFQAQELATGQADKALYQKEATGKDEGQLSMLQKLELAPEQHLQLINHCQSCGIEFLSTAFDHVSIDLLVSLKLKRWKIPSGEITNLPYLRKIGSLKQPVILSTGMAHLGEIEAAIAREQLHKLPSLVASRQAAAARLTAALSKLPGLTPPTLSSGRTHVYYVYGMKLDLQMLGTQRDWIVDALKAEGVTGLFAGYQNIHLLPIFRNRIAYGVHGFPWKGLLCGESEVVYDHGLCPVAEQLHAHSFFGLNLCAHDFNDSECDAVIRAFQRVWACLPVTLES